MSEPSPTKSELPIIPALVVSSLLGAVITLGAVGLWNWMRSGPQPTKVASAPTATLFPRYDPTAFQEFYPPLTPEEQRIEKVLEASVELQFSDTPLTDVVIFLKDSCGIEIVIDREALQAEGIAPDTPITYQTNGQRLRAALELILGSNSLYAAPRSDVLVVSTFATRRAYNFTRVYPVSDLCRLPGTDKLDYQSLMSLIESTTSGPWMNGESGLMSELGSTGALSIRHDYRGHREILELLRSLRQAQHSNLALADKQTLRAWDEARARNAASLLKPPAEAGPMREVIDNQTTERERQIEAALEKTVSWSFSDTRLHEVAKVVGESLAIPVLVDREYLSAEGIAPDAPITWNIPSMTARSALKLMLEPLQLSAAIDQEVLFISTKQRSEEMIVTRTYPVSDLVSKPNDLAALAELIETSTHGPWENYTGYGGTISEYPGTGSVVVRQSREAHREVLQLLRQQRQALPKSNQPRKFEPLQKPPGRPVPGGLSGSVQPGSGLFHVSSPSTIAAPAANHSDLQPRKRTNALD